MDRRDGTGEAELIHYKVGVEIENEAKPALSADWLTMLVFEDKKADRRQ